MQKIAKLGVTTPTNQRRWFQFSEFSFRSSERNSLPHKYRKVPKYLPIIGFSENKRIWPKIPLWDSGRLFTETAFFWLNKWSAFVTTSKITLLGWISGQRFCESAFFGWISGQFFSESAFFGWISGQLFFVDFQVWLDKWTALFSSIFKYGWISGQLGRKKLSTYPTTSVFLIYFHGSAQHYIKISESFAVISNFYSRLNSIFGRISQTGHWEIIFFSI